MVRNIHPDEMPQDVHLTQLYQDVLLDIATRRIEKSDEYLDEVQPSGWSEAPERPDQFKKKNLLTGIPVTQQFDESDTTSVSLREEVQEWPDGAQKVAKAIQEEFGVEGETFTQNDAVSLKSSFKKGSVRNYWSEYFKPEYVEQKGKDGKSKQWVWIKSVNKEDV